MWEAGLFFYGRNPNSFGEITIWLNVCSSFPAFVCLDI
ncbi:MAG: hypothetical protein GX971_05930 [Firmicutes bacterium]|nr:hypothetical protein [Bacillota bacterium]